MWSAPQTYAWNLTLKKRWKKIPTVLKWSWNGRKKPLSLIEQFPQLKTRRGEEEKHACMLPKALDIIEPTSKLFPVPCPRGRHCPEQKKILLDHGCLPIRWSQTTFRKNILPIVIVNSFLEIHFGQIKSCSQKRLLDHCSRNNSTYSEYS